MVGRLVFGGGVVQPERAWCSFVSKKKEMSPLVAEGGIVCCLVSSRF